MHSESTIARAALHDRIVLAGDGAPPTFQDLYETHFAFVWRSVRRLGVDESAVDDVVQEIFLVVHRKLGAFEGRSQVKTWLFGIVRRVVADHRRSLRRKPLHTPPPNDAVVPQWGRPDCPPDEWAARQEALRFVNGVLDAIDDEKREVFMLAELEQMTLSEIADLLGLNVNTVFSRLKAARLAFERAVADEGERGTIR